MRQYGHPRGKLQKEPFAELQIGAINFFGTGASLGGTARQHARPRHPSPLPIESYRFATTLSRTNRNQLEVKYPIPPEFPWVTIQLSVSSFCWSYLRTRWSGQVIQLLSCILVLRDVVGGACSCASRRILRCPTVTPTDQWPFSSWRVFWSCISYKARRCGAQKA